MPLPDRLKAMRERLGLTLEQVSGKTGIGVSSLSEFENGKRDPGISHLQKLSAIYETALSSFFQNIQPAQEAILWRDKPPKPGSDQIEARFLKLCRQYRNLEEWTKSRPTDSFRNLMTPVFPKDYPEASKLAHRVHDELGLGNRPGASLLNVLEEVYGVKIFHLELEGEASSASFYNEEIGPAIMLNSDSKIWRRNFDLAHELFHLITWRAEGRLLTTSDLPNEQEEKLANVFASRLLLPDQSLRDAIETVLTPDGKISYDDLYDVARQFEVSIEALYWRLVNLYHIPKDDADSWVAKLKKLSGSSARKDKPAPEYPKRYFALAFKALRLGEISTARMAEYLGKSVSEIRQYLNTDVPEPAQISACPS
jgi:Zn-dependent peptidase ImmA (M78 family)/transcriptional regulator with XRE-family HTH domain